MLAKYIDALQELRSSITTLQLEIIEEQELEWAKLSSEPINIQHKIISLKFGKRTGASTWAERYANRNNDVIIICPDVCRSQLLYSKVDPVQILIVPSNRTTLRKVDYDMLLNKVVIFDGYLTIPVFVKELESELMIFI